MTHKTAVKASRTAQELKDRTRAFWHISSISLRKVKIGRINLQKVADENNGKSLFVSHFLERVYQVASIAGASGIIFPVMSRYNAVAN